MKTVTAIRLCFWSALFLIGLPVSGDINGKSREEVVAAFGQPTSALNSSSREILNYPQGQVVLVEGLVTSFRGTFSIDAAPSNSEPAAALATPQPSPQAPPATTAAPSPQRTERRSIQPFRWSHTLADAKTRSVEEGRPILALFTGPDWCGPCQQLEAEVLNTTEFKHMGRKRYIPLKIALYRNSHQTPEAKAEYNRLSAAYGIEAVPSFLILDAEGTLTARMDLFKRRRGVSNLKEQVFAAIEDAENGGGGGLSFYAKIGIGAVLAGVAFVFLRK